MHACAFKQIYMTVAYFRKLLNKFFLKFERKILKNGKVIAVLIEFLNSRASRAPTCMHVHKK